MIEQNRENLSTVSDIELLKLIRIGDENAFEEITNRYKPLVSAIAKNYYTADFDFCDFVQEGLLGLLKACKTFDEKAGCSFKTYVSICIKNRFISVLRKANSKDIIPNENIVPIDDVDIYDKNLSNPEELVLSEERLKELLEHINNKLSKNEILVFYYYLKGMIYQEIVNITGLTVKAVDNALQRVKKKLRELN